MAKKQSKDPLDHNIETLVLFAVRYAMGRKSTAPSCVADWLLENWGQLSFEIRSLIQRDIEFEIKRDDQYRANHPDEEHQDYPLGWNCDRQTWLNLRQLWRDTPNVFI